MRNRLVLFLGLIATLIAGSPLRANGQTSSGGGALGATSVLAGVVVPPAVISLSDARVIAEYRDLGPAGQAAYAYGRYRVTSVFTAEEPARGREARETVPEEVVVLFRSGDQAAQSAAVWQMRYEVGLYGALRSITPQVADTRGVPDGVLLRVEECVNGTGGCGQDFLHFRRGAWAAVEEVWWGQLPAAIRSRVLHGVQIDARTLHAEGGLYRPDDPNCCPSDLLTAQLRLVGDSLVLQSHQVQQQPR